MSARGWAGLCAAPILVSFLAGAAAAKAPRRPSLLLVTLDTTRADHLGSYGGRPTPALDRLARRGTRYTRAVAPAPLTLPAHASLLTGLDPPHHGLRDNGMGALPSDVPTLAEALRGRGYATAAFVASRVLDRRFGLARGFQTYDDVMTAERVGAQGYAERDARAVTTAAATWLARQPVGQPVFLWVHYYDPHAPYAAPGASAGAPDRARYQAEVAYMDAQLGRLLDGVPAARPTLVAVVGDHGEMLGEHGEADHGIFLYEASLHVPLLLAGPGVPAGRTVEHTVPTRALAATLLSLLGASRPARFGSGLPGLGVDAGTGLVAYSESQLPATAYGWSALRAVTDGRWRYIDAPRPELYDLAADAREERNLAGERAEEAARLRALLASVERAAPARVAQPVAPDPEVAEALRSLGYHSGASAAAPAPRGGRIDPKDGIALLHELERAKTATREGRAAEAVPLLEDLLRRSPGNVPFLTRLAEAQAALGRTQAAAATLAQAVQVNPSLEFLRLRLAEAHFGLGRLADARAEYEAALALDPRSSRAWMGLAEIALRQGRAAEERAVLQRALEAGVRSAAVLGRLAQIEAQAGDAARADAHAAEAVALVPEFAAGWWVWGEAAEKRGQGAEAARRFTRAIELGLATPSTLLHLGRLLAAQGRRAEARPYLERAARDGGPAGAEARRLLEASR
jgi:arylsulfatase A-like enzyme/predicted Zn-dependent protease